MEEDYLIVVILGMIILIQHHDLLMVEVEVVVDRTNALLGWLLIQMVLKLMTLIYHEVQKLMVMEILAVEQDQIHLMDLFVL